MTREVVVHGAIGDGREHDLVRHGPTLARRERRARRVRGARDEIPEQQRRELLRCVLTDDLVAVLEQTQLLVRTGRNDQVPGVVFAATAVHALTVPERAGGCTWNVALEKVEER